ncbi:MAG: hypothetical protein P8I93_02140 [Crocinitomicaceae bacterium]|nr:hypothetical protein [Crocinitomicaceae bacterium]
MKNAKNTIKNTRVLDYLVALILILTLFGLFPEYYQKTKPTLLIVSALVIFESIKFTSMIFRYFFIKRYFKKAKNQPLISEYIPADFGAHISSIQKEYNMQIRGHYH